jgi:diguanylate cyclase (GGDEF)-like protein/PAS domain S-box-containing protein
VTPAPVRLRSRARRGRRERHRSRSLQGRCSGESGECSEREHAFNAAVSLAVQQASPDGILLVDSQERIVFCNQRFAGMWSVPAELIAGRLVAPVLDLVAGLVADKGAFLARVEELYAHKGEVSRDEIRLKDGRTLDRYSAPVSLDDGTYVGRVWFFRDLTGQKRSELALRESEERFRAVSDAAPDAIIIVDSDARVTYWNQAAQRILGYTTNESIGRCVYEWLVPARLREKARQSVGTFAAADRGEFPGKTLELVAIRKDGVEVVVELSISSVLLGEKWHAVVILRDITERKRAAEQIGYAARHDALTGLGNRTLFVDALKQAITGSTAAGQSVAVLYIDLDNFKDVNDTLGHAAGDELLRTMAKRLRASVRETDTVARFGGDEFALIEFGLRGPANAAVLANKLLKTIGEPLSIQGREIRAGASVGIAVYGLDSPDAETLMSHADVALYRAKSEGRGTYRFFTEEMDVAIQTRVALGGDLRDAVGTPQIFLMYQPQVDIAAGRVVGVEALARWRHPKNGLIPPSRFIPLAEQAGLIVALGHWVLRESCRQMKEWLDAGVAPPQISVNVSGLQFKTPLELEGDIAAVLADTGLPPQRLELELTESVLMDASDKQQEVLLRLRKAGLRIAIDDFGNGYSSLNYLARFPVDRIKIAQNFVSGLANAPRNAVIVRTSIGLAHELNLDIVVEGVETTEQLERVRSWGGRIVQGYYYSRPLLPVDLTALLRAGKIGPASAIRAENAATRRRQSRM